MYFLPASCAAATDLSSGQSARTFASFTSIGRLIPATTSTFGRFITEIERLEGVPPNMSVRITTPSPRSARFTASMMSRRRCSTSSSGPMVTVSICFCSPTTCSNAARNSTASRPWVTRTRPIIGRSKNSGRREAPHRSKARHHDHVQGERKGVNGSRYIFCNAIVKVENRELLVRFGRAQRSKYKGIRVCAARDRKSREGNASYFRSGGRAGGEAFGIHCRKVDDQPHCRDGLERDAADPKSSHFQETGERLRGPHQQPPVRRLDMHAIVPNKAGERQRVSTRVNERERQARFAGACRSTD